MRNITLKTSRLHLHSTRFDNEGDVNILLYNPDNGVSRNFMPHLWMFLLQSLTPPDHPVFLIDGNAQPVTEQGLASTFGNMTSSWWGSAP